MRKEQMDGQSTTGTEKKLTDMAEWVGKHQQALRQYCRSLAGSPWEGDDLVQDTWLKVWSALLGGVQGERITQAYLYRVARNAWIDRTRKKVVSTVRQSLEDDIQTQEVSSIEIWAAMETLVQNLAPVQRTALLLVDILKYTAEEAAVLVNSTEGAVKAALHRARTKLKAMVSVGDSQQNLKADMSEPGSRSTSKSNGRHEPEGNSEVITEADELTTYAYVEAFRQQNTAAMIMLMNDGVTKDAVVSVLNAHRRSDRSRTASHQTTIRNLSMQLAA
ncbi:RNA polymerase sigma factor (sigma-70 family) [Fontibacillus phaseoli]|uniref:RNA polymerase sigma factor (Sigma-70 family) n=1 Tax=Fontibacillus phaseoli TaxID=1416533 RepID=A0A369AYW0_9BACL|nr:RNA polymerase sigma factor [Fontibacillus phaseoli]RCX14469.1 RNA polymerase sigma factor (sigma-70 family) [Fontibacillus phaseoli]